MSLVMNFLALVSGTLRRAWLRLSRGLRLALRVAAFALIVAPAPAATYTVNGDGTVTDAATGLTWTRCSVGQNMTSSTCSGLAATDYWFNAAALAGSTFAGHRDWRLPSVRELQTILDRTKYNPSIDAVAFPNTPGAAFWSATDYAVATSAAWYVRFNDSYVGSVLKLSATTAHVRMVRGGQSTGALNPARPNADYTVNADGATVTHVPTGLMWKRCAEGQTWAGTTCSGSASSMTWNAASAATGNVAGLSDWRLPSADELLSLADYTKYSPAYNAAMFPGNPVTSNFWSSSAHAGDSTFAWYVGFGDGFAGYVSKAAVNSAAVRLVRAATPSTSSTSTTATTSTTTTTTTAPIGTATTTTATTSTTVGGTTSTTQSVAGTKPMIAAGGQFALALKADGTVSAWGRNTYGQLGNGQAALRVAPAKVDGVDRITAVVAGSGSTLALRDDGTVWGWGFNVSGNLGDGTTANKSHPVRVTGLVGTVKSVDISQEHALAVTTDGNVWAWGWGLYGQLGHGGTGNRSSAFKVSGLPAVGKVAAGYSHSLALAVDGTVWAWGDNSRGQLGDGTTTQQPTPVRVGTLSNIVAISARATSNLALDTSGRVWAWGFGGWGALGSSSYSDRATPLIVPGLPQITAVVSGNQISVATAADGSVWMWGDNESGQFGNAGYGAQPSPVKVSALAGYSGFAVGARDVLARDASGALKAWGENSYGQLGVGDANDRSAPALVTEPVSFTQVSAGDDHTVAVAGDGSVWAWGANGDSQLADGTASLSNRPADVQGLGQTIAVAAGQFHALALGGDGSVWAWGANGNGEFGNGGRRNSALPQRIPALPAMAAVAAGNQFSLALEQNGSVWSWGRGAGGQLGDGLAGRTQLTPQKLTTISGVKQVSATDHVLALRQDGSVWAWGINSHGQLGDGSIASRSNPRQISGLSNIVAVAAGTFHSMALDSSGNVWAWGWGGELGDGTVTDRYTPVRVVGLAGAVAIAAGEHTGYAITGDGRLWAWGRNVDGELGVGSTDGSSLLPRVIEGVAGFQGMAGGTGWAVALRSDGTVWAWGRNFEGQLGDATFAQRNAPALAVNATIDGPLDLNPQVANDIPPSKVPPFFVTTARAGDLSRFTVATTTKFNAADVGKPGSVFVTAMVPSGSLVPAQSTMSAAETSGVTARAATAANPLALIQLTASAGWQPVVSGQLLPYASGVLGDQLAAQTILNNTDTSNLNGAAFCIGYGTSADQMIAANAMRAVATVPDPNAAGPSAANCIVDASMTTTTTSTTSTSLIETTTTTASTTTTTLAPAAVNLNMGWNLLGNSSTGTLDVAGSFGDANNVSTVWKWIANSAKWAFYAPSLVGQALTDYAASKGYDLLAAITGGEGFWVNAKQATSVALPSGAPVTITALSTTLIKGWNLSSIGETATPKQFCDAQTSGVTTLWAWDATQSTWYFYAPSLDASSGLSTYIASKGYLDFTTANRALGQGVGFWLNKP